jgi:DNA polymerase-3 subunit delta
LKIKSTDFLEFIKFNLNNYKFVLLHGPNYGLVNQLYNNVLNKLSIDINDPFNVSKINTQKMLDDASILSDELSTYSLMLNKRIVLLDLSNISFNKKIIDSIILSTKTQTNESLLIIKADNLGNKNELVKFINNANHGILVPCYEEDINQIKAKLSNILREFNLKFSDSFLLNLSSKFSNDSSINTMELEKLRNFLSDNETTNETQLLELITDNSATSINKVINFCAIGDVKNALFFFNKTLDASVSCIIIIRALIKHFKLIEKIQYEVQLGNHIDNVMKNIRPPIFFKDQPAIIFQSNFWNLEKINILLKRFVDTEIKSKSGLFSDKLLVAQLILSTSVMAKNLIKP